MPPPPIPALTFHVQVRKVSNKLFSDPRSSVRRSQRLAALNTAAAAATSGGHGGGGGGGPSGGGGGGGGLSTPYGAWPATSVQGQAKSGQASYVEVSTREVREDSCKASGNDGQSEALLHARKEGVSGGNNVL